jgi:hypothetical protein
MWLLLITTSGPLYVLRLEGRRGGGESNDQLGELAGLIE